MHATHYMPQLFCRHIWNKSGLALFAGLVVLTTVAEAEESHAETQRDKLAAEEDQQAQRNASFPTAQRSALETELKKAQERAQRAERNLSALEAALAEKDDQLETELKKAQERAQLAEKHSDLSEPNAGPKAEPLASTQPSDSSVQSSETTARPGPASNSVPAAIESWNEENRGIGFAEATALIAVEANPAPQHDPLTSDQQPVKLVRINQSRSPVPLPTPSAAASMQSTPPEAQTDGRIWISREVQSLKELILEYHRLTMISRRQNSSPQMGTPDSSQIPIPALASEINQPDAQANVSPESSARGHDSARMIPPKILNIRHRSVVPSRLVDVKARLIALWHQSLARSQRASSRPVLSNSNKDANKKDDAKLTID
jgi:Skp family chaperone for outer membrane proteins